MAQLPLQIDSGLTDGQTHVALQAGSRSGRWEAEASTSTVS